MAKNAIVTINAAAKKVFDSKGNRKSWKQCIKDASAQYRSGKIGKTVKKKSANRQTGTSNKKRDRQRSAKPPGKRTVKHRGAKSTTYFERRKNRSDVPGTMTGTTKGAYNEMMMRRLTEAVHKLNDAEKYIHRLQMDLKAAPDKVKKSSIRNVAAMQRKYISSLKSDIRIIKSLIK